MDLLLLVCCWCLAPRAVDGWCHSRRASPRHTRPALVAAESCSQRPSFLPARFVDRTTTSSSSITSSAVRTTTISTTSLFDRYNDDDDDRSPRREENEYDDFRSDDREPQQQRRRPPTTRDDYYNDNESLRSGDANDDSYYYNDDSSYSDAYANGYSKSAPPSSPTIEWEEIVVPSLDGTSSSSSSTSYVLLPPSPPTLRPTAILHFVGGTFFGSAPQLWYQQLLEDIVVHTQCAVVVTPLPVITPLNSAQGPLEHVQIARHLQHSFAYAFRHVLQDEYGGTAMQNVPIAGLGHSLGARLLVVLATLSADQNKPEDVALEEDNSKRQRRNSKKKKQPTYEYKSLLLISFTNHGASAGIPGISSLLKQSRKVEKKAQEEQQRSRSRRNDDREDEEWDDDVYGRQRPRRRRQQSGYDDDDDDDDGDDWTDLLSDLQSAVQSQAQKVKTVLTPAPHELEFYPTPTQLWQALQQGRYRIPQTLLLQFDQDDMDQSAKLATTLLLSSQQPPTTTNQGGTQNATMTTSRSSSSTDARTTTTREPLTMTTTSITDLKFARLRGTHLTPISIMTQQQNDKRNHNKGKWWQEWSLQSTQALWKVLQKARNNNQKTGDVAPEVALRHLRQSLTRYITDVLTK